MSARRIAQINASMRAYLDSGLFYVLNDSYVYVERTVAPGRVRRSRPWLERSIWSSMITARTAVPW